MFALYAQQTGSAALWIETQNVKPDAEGNYTVLLGAASASGVLTKCLNTGGGQTAEGRGIARFQCIGHADEKDTRLLRLSFDLHALLRSPEATRTRAASPRSPSRSLPARHHPQYCARGPSM